MSSSRQRGMSLIEVVVFIVVLGIGIAGMAVLYDQLTRASVDPVVRKQALAIANSLMEEIQLRPFTYCDPDDALVFTETSATGCTSAATRESNPPLGPEGETRSGATSFDNVSDYNGFQMLAGIQDVGGTPVAGLAGYEARVTVAEALEDELPGFKAAPSPAEAPLNDGLRITVEVRHPGTGVNVTLQGYRVRYAPNSP